MLEAHAHRLRRGERLAASGGGAAIEAEERHDAVADELVDMAARFLDGMAHLAEIAVEEEHHVVGKLALGEAGEGAEIGEENGDLALAAGKIRGTAEAVARLRRRRQERGHAQIAAR